MWEWGVGQDAIIRTGHGTTDLFQIETGVCQGCILSPAYLTYMQSTSYKMPAGMSHKPESEHKLKSLFLKEKGESENLT